MSYTYLSSVLTTIEKQFGIKSQEAAWIFSGNEISQICFIFVLPFLGRLRKRIMWTSIALFVSAVGIFLCSMPYLVRDKTQYEGGWKTQSISTRDMCGGVDNGDEEDKCKVQKIRDWGGMSIIFIGFFITGIGSSFFYSFGIPYIDDNVSKQNSPMAMSLILSGRTLGPALGYLLGTASLKIYVLPGKEGNLSEGEEGWLGAWWLGFIVISALTFVLSPFLALFPERLPTEDDTEAKRLEKEKIEEPKTAMDYVRDTLNCGKRLLKNKVYVFNSLSTIFYLFGFIGFGTFVPKYFEYHFRRSASSSGSSGGMSKAIGSVVGMLISGYVLGRFKFRSRVVSGWNVFIGCAGVAFFIAASFVACPKLEINGGLPSTSSSSTSSIASCQSSCQCSQSLFHPTCSSDGVTQFFSPCHAGCSQGAKENVTVSGRNVVRKVYSSCSCVNHDQQNLTRSSPWWRSTESDLHSPLSQISTGSFHDQAIDGYCPFDCSRQFGIIIGMLTCFSLLGSTGRIGNQLLSLRAVDPKDKAASLIIMVSLLSLFVFMPSPIIVANIMGKLLYII